MSARLRRFTSRALALRLQPAEGAPVAPAEAHRIDFFQGVTGTAVNVLEERRDRHGLTGSPDLGTSQHSAFVEGFTSLGEHAHPLLEIGGLRQSVYGGQVTRYNPLSEGIAVATADFWQAGTLRRLTDARAKLSELRIAVGARPQLRARIEGLCEDITEAEPPELPLPAPLGAIAGAGNARARVITAGQTPALPVWAKSLDIDLRPTFRIKDYTGHREHAYVDRQPVFTLTLAKPALSDFDPWALRRSGTAIVARLWLEDAGGKCVEIGARGRIRDIVELDLDGDYGLQLTGPCIATRPGGNEVWVAFGPAAVMGADYYDEIEAVGGPEQQRRAGSLLYQAMNIDYPEILDAA